MSTVSLDEQTIRAYTRDQEAEVQRQESLGLEGLGVLSWDTWPPQGAFTKLLALRAVPDSA